MQNIELGYRAKAYLSWAIATAMVALMDDRVAVAELHPGGGQYDCLSLITPDGRILFQANRNGQSIIAGDEMLDGVFDRAAYDSYESAYHCMSEGSLPAGDFDPAKAVQINAMTNIANWLNMNIGNDARVVCAWGDGSYGAGTYGFEEKFQVPEYWKSLAGPYPGAGWQAWCWALKLHGEDIALVNLATGGSIKHDGSEWNRWPIAYEHEYGHFFPHYGYNLRATDQKGNVAYDNVVHVSKARYVTKTLMEELFDVKKSPAFTAGNQSGLIEYWADLENGY